MCVFLSHLVSRARCGIQYRCLIIAFSSTFAYQSCCVCAACWPQKVSPYIHLMLLLFQSSGVAFTIIFQTLSKLLLTVPRRSNCLCSSAFLWPLTFDILFRIAWWSSAGKGLFSRLFALGVLFYAKAVLLLWFILIVYVRSLSVCLWHLSFLFRIAWWSSAGKELFPRLSALDALFYAV